MTTSAFDVRADGLADPMIPTFVVSLDFELRWGRHDRLGLDMEADRRNLENEREVVPPLLKLFTERSIQVTWATVGAVACRDWGEYFDRAPAPPGYEDRTLAVDRRYADLDPDGRLHFAPELVDQVLAAPGQELGTHTFSHLLLREPGVTTEDAAADLRAVARLWSERFSIAPESLVFPRNQHAFLDAARANGVRIWRGNPCGWYHDSNEAVTNRARARLLRLLDDTNPWSRRAYLLEGDMTRASLFLRLDLPSLAWRVHAAHVKRELDALAAGEIFHLWWHPRNAGEDMDRGLARIRQILDLVAERVQVKALQSLSMGDLARQRESRAA